MDRKYENREDHISRIRSEQMVEMTPVLRGCPNGQCFCTGKCREIIGYRDVHGVFHSIPENDDKYER